MSSWRTVLRLKFVYESTAKAGAPRGDHTLSTREVAVNGPTQAETYDRARRIGRDLSAATDAYTRNPYVKAGLRQWRAATVGKFQDGDVFVMADPTAGGQWVPAGKVQYRLGKWLTWQQLGYQPVDMGAPVVLALPSTATGGK